MERDTLLWGAAPAGSEFMRFFDEIRRAIRSFQATLRADLTSTLVIVLSLGIAISANTVIFGFVNALLLKRQPGIENVSELVDVGATQRGQGFDLLSFPNFFDYQRESSNVFSALAAYTEEPRSMSFRTSGQADHVWEVPVTANLFAVLEAKPAAGRLFEAADEQPDREPVAVISYRFWETRFGREASVIGRKVVLNTRPFTIIGVAPKGLDGINFVRTDLWTLLVTEIFHRQEHPFGRGNSFALGIGRLKPGVSIETAQADLDLVSAQLQKEYPVENRGKGARVIAHTPFASALDSSVYAFVAMLFAIAGLVLLIACANVAGVCVARTTSRTREIAIRIAIGASRLRVTAQIMAETGMLFVTAGAVSFLVALWLNALLSNLQSLLPLPIVIDLAPDARVVAFVIGLIVVAGIGCGVVPALQASHVTPATAMKDESPWTMRPSRLRNGFVVVQIAISMLLLVVGGLFVRTLSTVSAADPGIDPQNVEAVLLDWFISGYGEDDAPGRQALDTFERTLLGRIRALPNVDSASIGVDLPLDGRAIGFNVVTIPELRTTDRQGMRNVNWNLVSPGYFRTMRIPMLRGRDFTAAEREGVAVVSETMAQRFWPGEDAIGKQFYDGSPQQGRTMQVIGVAKDVNTRYPGRVAEPLLYAPLGQYSWRQHYVMVRTVDGASIVPALRRIFVDLNPNLPIVSVQSMKQIIARGLLPQRIAAWMALIMGLLGALLASLGIYAITAFSVSRRTREIGIRTALGARPGDVLRFVFREGAVLAVAGIAIGTASALALTRLIAGFLFGISPTDTVSFLVTAAVLAVVTLLATYIPARRALTVDPLVALRQL